MKTFRTLGCFQMFPWFFPDSEFRHFRTKKRKKRHIQREETKIFPPNPSPLWVQILVTCQGPGTVSCPSPWSTPHIPDRRCLLPTMSRSYLGTHPRYSSRIEDSVFLTVYPWALSLPLECLCWMNDKIANEGREGIEGVIPVRGTNWDSRSLQRNSHPATCFLGATTGNFKR